MNSSGTFSATIPPPAKQKLRITGAFGNLGVVCIEEALRQEMEVIRFDLDTPSNRKLAQAYLGIIFERHPVFVGIYERLPRFWKPP